MARGETAARTKLWGAALALVLLAPVGAQAAATRILYNFTNVFDGAVPYATVTPDPNGDFVGTAAEGDQDSGGGSGVLYRIKPSGAYKVLKRFGESAGASPQGEVAIDSKGVIYGTTRYGGAVDGGCGCGVVYRLGTGGAYRVLYTFQGGADGGYPHGPLLLGPDGALYGTTDGLSGVTAPVVFKVTQDGTETVLHTFTSATGDHPESSAVAMDAAGALYGTTSRGGDFNWGVVWKISPAGEYTVLHSFPFNSTDGGLPNAGVILDENGVIYGTTKAGGPFNGGVIFKIGAKGAYSVIHSFDSANGRFPLARVTRDAATGALYGTTSQGGGSCDCGVAFKLSASRKYTVLHRFTGNPDGRNAFGGLTLDDQGRLYGTTMNGGSGGTGDHGTVYRIRP